MMPRPVHIMTTPGQQVHNLRRWSWIFPQSVPPPPPPQPNAGQNPPNAGTGRRRGVSNAGTPRPRASLGRGRGVLNAPRGRSEAPPLPLRCRSAFWRVVPLSDLPANLPAQARSFDKKKLAGCSGCHFWPSTRRTIAQNLMYVSLVRSALFVSSQRKLSTFSPIPYRIHTWAI